MRAILVGAFVLVGCGDGGMDGPDADPGPADPQFSDPANLIVVREETGPATSPRGDAYAVFATDATGLLTETMRAGSCRLLTSNAQYCPGPDPCTGFCVDAVCHPWPTYRDAGRITFTGLRDAIALTFNAGYYAPDSFPLPADLFAADAAIEATAAGAAFPGFTVGARGVSTLAPSLTGTCDNEWHITRGQDAVIRWSAPVTGARVRLRIPSENNGHGLPPRAVIECEGPDRGEFRVPSALVAAMPDFREVDGCSGIACASIDCPPSTIARYSAGSVTAGSATVALRVESEVTFLVWDN